MLHLCFVFLNLYAQSVQDQVFGYWLHSEVLRDRHAFTSHCLNRLDSFPSCFFVLFTANGCFTLRNVIICFYCTSSPIYTKYGIYVFITASNNWWRICQRSPICFSFCNCFSIGLWPSRLKILGHCLIQEVTSSLSLVGNKFMGWFVCKSMRIVSLVIRFLKAKSSIPKKGRNFSIG